LLSAILLATLAAIGFSGASFLALLGREMGASGRASLAAVAAGILLALAFVDLFPEGLELAEEPTIVGFVAGFVLLFSTEAIRARSPHHVPEERIGKRALGPFVLGLAIHNLADGFVLGVGAKASDITAGLVGIGIIAHQAPVGISLAAVLVAARATRAQVIRSTVLLGLAIPLAAGLTAVAPVPGDQTLGFLIGVAGGVLAYIGAAHLLPEAQAINPSRITSAVFAATLIGTTVGLMTFLGH
jgi:zinc transporter, ZIP family